MHMHRCHGRILRLALVALLLGTAIAVRASEPVPTRPSVSPLIVVDGTLDLARVRRVEHLITRAVAAGRETILLDIRSEAPDPFAALDLADKILSLTDTRVVACVSGRALGGSALVALACDEIVMTAAGQIGAIDCGENAAGRSSVRAAANRYREGQLRLLIDAMIDPSLEIHVLAFGNGFIRITETADLDAALRESRDHDGLTSRERLVRKDDWLTLQAGQAKTLGLSTRTVADIDAAAKYLEIEAPVAAATATAEARVDKGEWAPKQCKRAAIIYIEDGIDAATEARIRRRLDMIKKDGNFDLVVIETDSPGGTVHHSMIVGDLIFELGSTIHTVAWVRRVAYSGAALTSYAARDIVMSPVATIGDCQPIFITGGGYETAGEKMQSPLRAVFRKYAQRNGYPSAVAESMVTQELEVLRLTHLDGSHRYLTRKEYESLPPDERSGYGEPKMVVEKDRLPTFTADESIRWGLARRVIEKREDMLALYGVTPANTVEYKITWSEEVSAFLLAWKGLLFLIGLVSLYLEFKVPGFGVAGFVGIAAFALYFFAGSIGGVADSLEIVLFVAGVALIMVEMFLIPGFGIAGIGGLGLMVVSLYLASTPFIVPNSPLARTYLTDWLLHFSGAVFGSVICAVIIAKTLPSIPLFNRLLLVPPADAAALTASGAAVRDGAGDLIGRKGSAITALRPAGRILIDERRLDVVTQGAFVPEGGMVEVVKVKGNRIVVRALEDKSPDADGEPSPDRDYNY
jgi:membrane-bound serine protease (ClpP class)